MGKLVFLAVVVGLLVGYVLGWRGRSRRGSR
jgi:hypothetical protein